MPELLAWVAAGIVSLDLDFDHAMLRPMFVW